MNGSEITMTGIIENIIAKGAGPKSGEIGISLKEPHQSFWVFMDIPRDIFSGYWRLLLKPCGTPRQLK